MDCPPGHVGLKSPMKSGELQHQSQDNSQELIEGWCLDGMYTSAAQACLCYLIPHKGYIQVLLITVNISHTITSGPHSSAAYQSPSLFPTASSWKQTTFPSLYPS